MINGIALDFITNSPSNLSRIYFPLRWGQNVLDKIILNNTSSNSPCFLLPAVEHFLVF
jgi:hypothetical protein